MHVCMFITHHHHQLEIQALGILSLLKQICVIIIYLLFPSENLQEATNYFKKNFFFILIWGIAN